MLTLTSQHLSPLERRASCFHLALGESHNPPRHRTCVAHRLQRTFSQLSIDALSALSFITIFTQPYVLLQPPAIYTNLAPHSRTPTV